MSLKGASRSPPPGDGAGVATAKDGIGNVLQSQGRFREAIAAYRDSLAWTERAGDEQSRAVTLNNLANCELEAGNSLLALEGYLAAAAAFGALAWRPARTRSLRTSRIAGL